MDLSFSYNWNKKLDCQAFTTIRKTRYEPGTILKVFHKKEYIKTVYVESVKEFKLHQLNSFMSYLDTGYSVQECQNIIKKMYSARYTDLDTETFYFHLLVTV